MAKQAWLGMLVLIGLTSGCKTKLDMDKLKDNIRLELQSQAGTTITKVTCPEKPEVKKDATFECTAEVEGGGTLTITVVQKDDKGNIRWDVTGGTGMFVVPRFEEHLAEELSGRFAGAAIRVDCDSPGLRQNRPGDTFTCTGTGPEGWTVTVGVKHSDDQGNVDWEPTATSGVAVLDRMEQTVADDLKAKGATEATLDCGSGVRVAPVGSTIECTGTVDGKPVKVTATLTDNLGAFEWKMTSP